MAVSITTKCWSLLVIVVYASVFGFKLGNASEDLPETGDLYGDYIPHTGDVNGDHTPHTGDVDGDHIPHTGDVDGDHIPHTGDVDGDHIPHTGDVNGDPAQIVAKALLCFNDKYIYSSCEEAYRLKQGGNIDVPHEETDAYCEGPCLEETHLVLNCIDNILSDFLFYNKATVQDIRETLHAGCSYTSERGDFNVAEHIGYEESSAYKAGIRFGFLPVVIGCVLLI